MRIFLTGATGYIGSVVAEYLNKAGHSVMGLARSPEADRKLRAAGVEPVIGKLEDPISLTNAARQADGVIHTAVAWGSEMGPLDEGAVRAIITGLRGSNKPFLYTSGVWVIGPTKGHVAGEMAPLRPPKIVAWRPAVEKMVLASVDDRVKGIVIRPASVYGRGGGPVSTFIHQARELGMVRIVGDGENHWSFVHVDALANLYVLAVTQKPSGEMFLAADGPSFTVRTVADTVSAMYEVKVELQPVEEARKTLGLKADAMVMDQRIMSTKAGRLLGWAPRWPSVLEEIRSGSYQPE
jgi:nucleoside-diphosphate-sugar epimerase